MTIYHNHHLFPKHAGGTDDPSNIIRVSIKEHAEFHYERWVLLGEQYDKIAWRMLSGQISVAQAIKEKQIESGRKAGLLGKGKPKSLEHNRKDAAAQIGNDYSKNKRWMNKDGKHTRVSYEYVHQYLDSGWNEGRLLTRDPSGRFKGMNT